MYYDILIKIKNAQSAGKRIVKVPYTAMSFAIIESLAKKGFVASVEKKGKGLKRISLVTLAEPEKQFKEIKFLSKPSRRFYTGYKNLKPVRQGYGLSVVSTPKGVMTGEEARKHKVGGELLLEVW